MTIQYFHTDDTLNTILNANVRLAITFKTIYIVKLRPFECRYVQYVSLGIIREKAGSNRHTPLRQSGTLPIMLFSL